MKQKYSSHRHNVHAYQPAYPNAADTSYFINKALNALVVIASSVGFVSAMLFLITLA